MAHELRPYRAADRPALLELYRCAVQSQCAGFYNAEQVQAWAGYASADGAVAAAIERGWTLVNPVHPGSSELAAFAVLDPSDRLSLLYCDGRYCRQGRASALLTAAETHAREQGVRLLRTEASQLSRPLLLRHGWRIDAKENVLFAAVRFVRWRMIKALAG